MVAHPEDSPLVEAAMRGRVAAIGSLPASLLLTLAVTLGFSAWWASLAPMMSGGPTMPTWWAATALIGWGLSAAAGTLGGLLIGWMGLWGAVHAAGDKAWGATLAGALGSCAGICVSALAIASGMVWAPVAFVGLIAWLVT